MIKKEDTCWKNRKFRKIIAEKRKENLKQTIKKKNEATQHWKKRNIFKNWQEKQKKKEEKEKNRQFIHMQTMHFT